MKKVFLFTCIALLTLSCVDDAFLPDVGEKLLAVYIDDIKYYEFEYNTDGLLQAEKSKFQYFGYSYDKSKGVISKEIYYDSRVFSSNSHVLEEAFSRSEWVNPQNTDLTGILVFEFDASKRLVKSTELNGYSEYEYDNNDRIIIRRIYHNGKLAGTREYEYDIQGNVIKDNHFILLENGSKVLSSTSEYEYDNMKNPYYNLKPDRFPVENINPNNITRKKYTVSSHPDADSDIQYTYQYNSLGYPTEKNDGVTFSYSK
ncbi:hypothetical protein [Aquiflexum sp.]|uniref:hypothetical protein n=1 Tax=Aquiflexum sp. TaxID=1872584 RepID=UPI003593BB33